MTGATPVDVLIVGASLGGVAAALRASAMGASVLLVEETDWVGGQLTSQGVCTPDENAWIEAGGGCAAYQALRRRIRAHYSSEYVLSQSGREQRWLNPGSCWVSRISVEPRVAERFLSEMLASAPRTTVMRGAGVAEIAVDDDRITHVAVRSESGTLVVAPRMVLDATELGDTYPLCGAEHSVGADSRHETGEPDAPDAAHPSWIQPFTVPFALELRPRGEDHTIERPAEYEAFKRLQRYHVLDGAMRGMFGELGWWTYRRVIACENFADLRFAHDIAMVNTGSNDYMGGVIPTGDATADARTVAAGRRASLCYVYWLQTECPRADLPGRSGYPELRLRGDWFGSDDGLALHPYIRESRRLVARRIVREQDIVARDACGRQHQAGPRATHYDDACGIGHYWLDVHAGPSPEPGLFLETRPYQVPMGALVPVRVRNLLASCKNLGVTHLTNGAFRLHPVEWAIGEAAGALAASCVAHACEPGEVLDSSARLRRVQRRLVESGSPIFWWGDLPSDDPAFAGAQMLAMSGAWPGGDSIEFGPDSIVTDDITRLVGDAIGPVQARAIAGMTRREAVRWLVGDPAARDLVLGHEVDEEH